jgi:DnaJ-class molecular chaperone
LSSVDTKLQIRKRLFLEAVRNGKREPNYGFEVCSCCKGRGTVCVERNEAGHHSASFELCAECHGETIVLVLKR